MSGAAAEPSEAQAHGAESSSQASLQETPSRVRPGKGENPNYQKMVQQFVILRH